MKSIILTLGVLISLNAFAADKELCSAASKSIPDSEDQLLKDGHDQYIFQTVHQGIVVAKTVIEYPTQDVWDGHASGLITGKGLAISYDGNFGCIDNVEVDVLANRGTDPADGQIFRHASFGLCLGWSASFCGPH